MLDGSLGLILHVAADRLASQLAPLIHRFQLHESHAYARRGFVLRRDYRLRQQIQREQGETFDLGRFHEAVLAHGSVPVKYLPELVRRTLTEKGGGGKP